jgi:hypothetical protein
MRIMPEGLLNVNAGMIMITCFFFAHLSSKLRATNSMILGTIMTAVAFTLIGFTAGAWACFFGIIIFSTGEMFSSPKFSEFIGNFAPEDKKAMYLGFSQLPLAVGWMAESYFGAKLYGKFSAKETLSREWLADNGMPSGQIDAIPIGEAFTHMVEFTGRSPESLTQMLYEANNVGLVWYLMAVVAVFAAIGLFLYGRWILTLVRPSGQVAPQPAVG